MVQLGFKSQTVDAEIGHSTFVGQRNHLTYGGNVRGAALLRRPFSPLFIGVFRSQRVPFRVVCGGQA